MTKVKKETLKFSKFFPESTSFVSVSGSASGSDNFNVDVKIGDGSNTISIFTTDWFRDDSLQTLKAIQEGITKAIEFQQNALKLPKINTEELFSFPVETKKKAAPKRVLKSTETVVKKK